MDPTSDIAIVGASGAITGELGAYMVLLPSSKVDSLVVLGFIMHVRVAALILIGAWIALQLLNDVGSLGVVAGGVAYSAHVGGFAAGAAFGLGFRSLRSRRGGSFWEPLDDPRPVSPIHEARLPSQWSPLRAPVDRPCRARAPRSALGA